MRSDTIKRFCGRSALAGQLARRPAMAATGDAETASSSGLEEIVVTATRRSERLQDVPISVIAFSQEKLDAQGLHNIDDLTRLSPGVNFQRNGMSSAGNYNDEGSDINIRGVDSTAGTSTTGIYIDDTPIQTPPHRLRLDQCLPGAVRPRPRRSAARPAGHAVRRRRRRRRGALHRARARSQQTERLCPRGRRHDRWRLPELRRRRRLRHAHHRRRAGFRASVSFRRDGGWVDRVGYTLSPECRGADPPTPVYNGDTTDAECELPGNHDGAPRRQVEGHRQCSRSRRRSTTSACRSTTPRPIGLRSRIPAEMSIATAMRRPIPATTRLP